MTPERAIEQARQGKLLPVYVVVGEERLFRDEVLAELRAASLGTGIAAFNEDRFTAGEARVEHVVAAARTVPMLAPRRFVLVRGAERWEVPEGDSAPFDRLAEYAAAPVESSCLVVVGSKLDGRRKFALMARKQDFLVACEPLEARALAPWIIARCASKGHAIDRDVADLIAAVAGPQLSPVDDAIERLSLYVGPAAPIDADAVRTNVTRVRMADAWAVVDAVGARDLGRALRTLADAYEPRDRGLPLLGAVVWSVRQLARFQAAVASGASADDAARRAGAFNPHRVRELVAKARSIPDREIERWLLVLAEADLALKSSRREPDAVLEDMLVRLCKQRSQGGRGARGAPGRAPDGRSPGAPHP
jgi:DNA polymerase-3 subunit delta